MQDIEVDWNKIDDHPAEAVRLFKILMRLEFSLKDCGFARKSRTSVEVDWDRYAKEKLGNEFYSRMVDNNLSPALRDAPPKHQDIQGNSLEWKQASPVSNIQELLGAVRRVRNNLFHGGKSGDPDADRNDDLISDAIEIITEILKADDVLHTIFSNKY